MGTAASLTDVRLTMAHEKLRVTSVWGAHQRSRRCPLTPLPPSAAFGKPCRPRAEWTTPSGQGKHVRLAGSWWTKYVQY